MASTETEGKPPGDESRPQKNLSRIPPLEGLSPIETVHAQLAGFLASHHRRHREAIAYIDSRGLIKPKIFQKFTKEQQDALKPSIRASSKTLRQMRKDLRKGGPPPQNLPTQPIPLSPTEQAALFDFLKKALEKTPPPDEETRKYIKKGFIKTSVYKKLSEEQKNEISALSHQYRLKFYPKVSPKHLP